VQASPLEYYIINIKYLPVFLVQFVLIKFGYGKI